MKKLIIICSILSIITIVINLNIDVIARTSIFKSEKQQYQFKNKYIKIKTSRQLLTLINNDAINTFGKKYFTKYKLAQSIKTIVQNSENPILFYAIAKRETQLNNDKISSSKAVSIFQIHPINSSYLIKRGIINSFEELKFDQLKALKSAEIIFNNMKIRYNTTDLELLLYAYSGYIKQKRRGHKYVTDILKTYACLQYKYN